MSAKEEVYKNRDLLLGEIHESTKNTEESIKEIKEWCKEHDKEDNRRFFIGALCIITIAVAGNLLPEIIKLVGG